MHTKALFVFWAILSIYLITLFTVSYVGVYFTYVAVPLIGISGLIVLFTKKKPSHKTKNTTFNQICKTSVFLLNETTSVVAEATCSLDRFNKKIEMIRNKTSVLKDEIQELKSSKIAPNINIKYSQTPEEKDRYVKIINDIDTKIALLEQKIESIKKECELELAGINQ